MGTINDMQTQDKERAKQGEADTNREELMCLAREEEFRVVKLEIEMSAAGLPPLARIGAQQTVHPTRKRGGVTAPDPTRKRAGGPAPDLASKRQKRLAARKVT